MHEDTAVAVMSLLERLKAIAANPQVDQISDEIRALVRCEAAPRLGTDRNKAWPITH